MKKALIVWGGWDGHEPRQTAEIMAEGLQGEGFEVEVATTLDAYLDAEELKGLDLIVNNWTMGTISSEQLTPLLNAVRSGVGCGGIHGGMCDAFREQTEYQFMCGGQWVAHPGGIRPYRVDIGPTPDPITAGIAAFDVTSEQYYMHVDPINTVLATTRFADYDNVEMPVVWKKMYGQGRVFYCSLGHSADVLAMEPVLTMVARGLVWAAKAE
ncbi:MAG: ThuA domain-containing protein [Armatimonadia bacterium]